MQTIEEYLLKFAILDKNGDLDGLWVPLHIAELAIQLALKNKLSYYKQRIPRVNKTHPLIWGDGWYAIVDPEYEQGNINTLSWCVAPKKYFEEKGYCPDGWDWEIPKGMDQDEFDDFVDEHGCEPDIPNEFIYVAESTIQADAKYSFEEQKKMLKDFGFIVDDVPKWKWDRK